MTQTPYIPGQPVALAPDLTCVLAPNKSPMTHWGTNSYIVGRKTLVVIDPGPDDPAHLAAILSAIDGRPVSHILVTHAHLDHSPLAPALRTATGAPVLGFGPATAGRSPVMQELARAGLAGGGEGVDHGFAPDITLPDGARLDGDWGTITALHTPGHIGNHLCFLWGSRLFSGDHVMGWASSLVSPPDGDLTDFMQSCRRLQQVAAEIIYPAHGAAIPDPATRLAWLISHREKREAQILSSLDPTPLTIPALTKRIYAEAPATLLPAAERNVFAHLIDLFSRGLVSADPQLGLDAKFAKIGSDADDEKN